MQKENGKDVIKQGTTLSIPREPLSGICSCRCETADPRQKHSGERNRLGFTLIELLVVVLIIGILAAVALPQYQKTVDKSRLVQLMVINKAIREAEERYYLANGDYTNDMRVLDLEFAATEKSGHYWELADGTSLYFAFGGTDKSIYTGSPLLPDVSLRSVYLYSGNSRAGKMMCYAKKNNARANRACKSIATGWCGATGDDENGCVVL